MKHPFSLPKSFRGRGDRPVSLTASLSRRLRTNGSVRRGQASSSPMFHAKKRGAGSGFESTNASIPEPSSPKVTCIGQVRVKSKKKKQQQQQQQQVKITRTLSRRHSGGQSFRRVEQNVASFQQANENRWVHLPLTICGALRSCGPEFSCAFPCRSSCFSTKDRVKCNGNGLGTCGAFFARWCVAMNHEECCGGGGGRRRDIELVIEGEDDEEREIEFEEMPVRSSRRHVFEDLKIVGDRIGIVGDEEERRMSICIPPKNALLLMRCRSDPVRMEALASRYWGPSIPTNYEDDEEEERVRECQEIEMELVDVKERKSAKKEGDLEMEAEGETQEERVEVIVQEVQKETEEDEGFYLGFLFEETLDVEDIEDNSIRENGSSLNLVVEDDEQAKRAKFAEEVSLLEVELEGVMIEERSAALEDEVLEGRISESIHQADRERRGEVKKEEENGEVGENRMDLPDCLLLMWGEPKLSMEVSKETWVCSSDFVRRQPEKKKKQAVVQPIDNVADSNKMVFYTKSKSCKVATTAQQQPVLQQARRSCCSLPAPAPAVTTPMASMIEQKLVNAAAYEPLVLTRCKSEPMRTAAAKLVPETCFWKNRKLEPLRRAAFGTTGFGY